MSHYRYRLFGLTIASELELPELAAAIADEEEADVRIMVAAIPPFADAGDQPQPTEGGIGIAIPGVARFVVSGGRSIVVDPVPTAAAGNVRLFLLGSAMGMLIHQAGMLPLHANAVVIGGRAFAFMGPSGSGKSTLAAWFHDRGHRVVSDDVSVLGSDEAGRITVSPGLPRLRLWREALERTGRQPERFASSYSGDESYDKFDVPIAADEDGGGPVSLGGIYLLEHADQRSIERMEGAPAVEALMANTYRGAYSSVAGQAQAQFHSCVELAMRVPLYRFSRSLTFESLEEDIRIILDHARRIAT